MILYIILNKNYFKKYSVLQYQTYFKKKKTQGQLRGTRRMCRVHLARASLKYAIFFNLLFEKNFLSSLVNKQDIFFVNVGHKDGNLQRDIDRTQSKSL